MLSRRALFTMIAAALSPLRSLCRPAAVPRAFTTYSNKVTPGSDLTLASLEEALADYRTYPHSRQAHGPLGFKVSRIPADDGRWVATVSRAREEVEVDMFNAAFTAPRSSRKRRSPRARVKLART